VVVLGSTGSIGTQTLDVLAHVNGLAARGQSPVAFELVGLAAGARVAEAAAQARAWSESACAGGVVDHAEPLMAVASGVGVPRGALVGEGAAEELVRRCVRERGADVVVAAMVGSSGLPATLAACELGLDVALANKETLVAAGGLVVGTARRCGARLLPIDSEHSGVWQALSVGEVGEGGEGHEVGGRMPARVVPPCVAPASVRRVVLTASGGAFWGWSKERMETARPEEALAHPTWRMGPKITVDCATMINKAFELVEAGWLFGLGPERLGVVVHRQSAVHALVEYADGSTVAQLGSSDMRVAIQHALTFPWRVAAAAAPLDVAALGQMTFEEADVERFPLLSAATRVLGARGGLGAVINAANEEAVRAFLEGGVPFGAIARTVEGVERVLGDPAWRGPEPTLDEVMKIDRAARSAAQELLGRGVPR
jgi:1-deoxy-D-xylulose-5-phosphate reductoisomerase